MAIEKFGVAGCGLIGSGIAQVVAQAGRGFYDYSDPKNPKPIEL